jgi:glyoxylase-like metal-dependent hydrolase (beta-lactamase superfamily II)
MTKPDPRIAELAASTDMEPVHGTIDLDIPADTLWRAFDRPWLWPRWNECFFWVRNRRLRLGDRLVWCFEPIKAGYLYKMPAIARIVELEEGRKVTWEVTALPGFYARHSYTIEDLGNGRSRFGSWEKACGRGFRLTRGFWLRHFTFVKNRSLEGARALEVLHLTGERLDEEGLPRRSYLNFFLALAGLAAIVAGFAIGGWWGIPVTLGVVAAGIAAWFYATYVKLVPVRLAPGVHAVLGGGGNSLVVEDGEDVLAVDTKFPPASRLFAGWLRRRGIGPVTKLVNTHYHYDHSRGNVLYPKADRIAHRLTSEAMEKVEGEWWSRHREAAPNHLVEGDLTPIRVGAQEVELLHLGRGHTVGDLVVRVPKAGVIATGDLIFNRFHCFFDTGRTGVSIEGTVAALRRLAAEFPDALFMPGHGPIARADDLRRTADYLEDLRHQIDEARRQGLDEKDAAQRVDLDRWDLRILPSFHEGRLEWATARSSARSVYRLLARSRT